LFSEESKILGNFNSSKSMPLNLYYFHFRGIENVSDFDSSKFRFLQRQLDESKFRAIEVGPDFYVQFNIVK